MAQLRWRTEPPLIGSAESAEEFLPRLSRWLKDQERDPEYDVEALLAVGGADVAQRLVGFEGLRTGYSPPEVTTLVAAPVAGKKRIVVSLYLFLVATVPTIEIYILKGAVEAKIAEFSAVGQGDIAGGDEGILTLDDTDESVVLRIISGTGNVSFAGAYLDVD